jgi:hypothetical protein
VNGPETASDGAAEKARVGGYGAVEIPCYIAVVVNFWILAIPQTMPRSQVTVTNIQFRQNMRLL